MADPEAAPERHGSGRLVVGRFWAQGRLTGGYVEGNRPSNAHVSWRGRPLHLIQEKQQLEAELSSSGDTVDLAALEKDFTKVAKAYGDRKGISYSAWRSVGVSAPVLQRSE